MYRLPDVRGPRIARIWRGRSSAELADRYSDYLYQHGVEKLAQVALGVEMMREDRANESHFVTISYWESIEAMSAYAGDQPRRIKHLARDSEFLLALPRRVQILDIVASFSPAPRSSVR